MTNIASVLKTEILRLARKVVREQADSLRSGLAVQRKQIKDLKRQVANLETQVNRLNRTLPAQQTQEARKSDEGRKPRFTPALVKKDRSRLGLSQEQYGLLIGVTALTVYNYEKGKAEPRRPTLSAIATLRTIGKREAHARLQK